MILLVIIVIDDFVSHDCHVAVPEILNSETYHSWCFFRSLKTDEPCRSRGDQISSLPSSSLTASSPKMQTLGVVKKKLRLIFS